MAVAPTLPALGSFRYSSCNQFPYLSRSSFGISPSSSPPSHPLRGKSLSTRPSPGHRRGQSLNSAAVLAAGAGLSLTAIAHAFPLKELAALPSLEEPGNALSLPTWAIHVSSVAEWVIAMALIWEYGEKSGFPSWKGLSWAMVPLLGGAMCACAWHFFYNSESLEILVAMQAALTLVGNMAMCIAAFRIFKAYEAGSSNS